MEPHQDFIPVIKYCDVSKWCETVWTSSWIRRSWSAKKRENNISEQAKVLKRKKKNTTHLIAGLIAERSAGKSLLLRQRYVVTHGEPPDIALRTELQSQTACWKPVCVVAVERSGKYPLLEQMLSLRRGNS